MFVCSKLSRASAVLTIRDNPKRLLQVSLRLTLTVPAE